MINIKIIWKIPFAQKLLMLTSWWQARLLTVSSITGEKTAASHRCDNKKDTSFLHHPAGPDLRTIKAAYLDYFIIWKVLWSHFLFLIWNSVRHVSITHPILQIKDKTDCLIFTEHPQNSALPLALVNKKVSTLYNLTVETEHYWIPFIFIGSLIYRVWEPEEALAT